VRIFWPQSAGANNLIDVLRRRYDLRIYWSHLQPAAGAGRLDDLGDDDVVVILSESCRVAAARHVTYAHNTFHFTASSQVSASAAAVVGVTACREAIHRHDEM